MNWEVVIFIYMIIIVKLESDMSIMYIVFGVIMLDSNDRMLLIILNIRVLNGVFFDVSFVNVGWSVFFFDKDYSIWEEV